MVRAGWETASGASLVYVPRRKIQSSCPTIGRDRTLDHSKMSLLEIKNLHARIAAPGGRDILKGVDLTINAGEVHAIMGKNGSGKSTLAQVLAGREAYEVTQGQILYEGKDLLDMSTEERAREGVFLAF